MRSEWERSDMAAISGTCTASGCGKPAKLWCPTCKELKLDGGAFCSQVCTPPCIAHVAHALLCVRTCARA
ncbi:hypothetical protein EON67_03275 [archaeon]|nr:MAG: hypothetical protein EON67_03275 [archaeon]